MMSVKMDQYVEVPAHAQVPFSTLITDVAFLNKTTIMNVALRTNAMLEKATVNHMMNVKADQSAELKTVGPAIQVTTTVV